MKLYDLIEAYLDDALPDAKRQEIEQRMAADEDFRQEVELHRGLQETYADPGRWHLRTALLAAMEEPLPPTEPPEKHPNIPISQVPNISGGFGSQRKWWFLLPVALFLGVGIWYFTKPDTALPVPQATDKSPVESPSAPTPAKEQEAPKQETQPALQKPIEYRPIAMADPKDFQENRSMEGLIKGTRDEAGLAIIMTQPKIGERFDPKPSGKTKLRFSGVVEDAPADKKMALNLLVFNNKNSTTPLLTQALAVTADVRGKAVFDIPVQVDFPKGLYYFRFEDEAEEPVIAGKFFIGSL